MPVSELTDKLGLQHLRSRTVRVLPLPREPQAGQEVKTSPVSSLILTSFFPPPHSGTSRPPVPPKAQAYMMGWTGCPMSCLSANQPGAGPCCPEAPACIPGITRLPDSSGSALPSCSSSHTDTGLCSCPSCLHVLSVVGAWSLVLWAGRGPLCCLLGPVEGASRTKTLSSRGGAGTWVYFYLFHFGHTLGARWGGGALRVVLRYGTGY